MGCCSGSYTGVDGDDERDRDDIDDEWDRDDIDDERDA